MLASFATKSLLDLAESSAELDLTGPYKLVALLTIEHKVELWDRLDLESLGCFSVTITFNSTEDDMFVSICPSSTLVCGFEIHARAASRRPEVNDNSMIVLDNCLELHKRRDLTHFSELWSG